MKTERMTLLVTPDEKAELTERASTLGISASELVRRAVQSYDPDVDEDALRELANDLAAAAQRTEAKVDAALAAVEAFEAYFEDAAGRRAEARAAVERDGLEWPFDLSPETNDAGKPGKAAAS